MKAAFSSSLAIFVISFSVVCAARIDGNRLFTNELKRIVESLRQQMPCGFPSIGIPPLAPLQLSHQQMNFSIAGVESMGQLDNIIISGLDEFDIIKLTVNFFMNNLSFEFLWHKVQLNGDYHLFTNLADFQRSGLAQIELNHFNLSGNIGFGVNIVNNTIHLKQFNVHTSLKSVISNVEGLSQTNILNKKINEFIEEWLMLAINENGDNLNVLTNDVIVPFINQILDVLTIPEIMAIVGIGNNSNESSQTEPCLPSSSTERLN